MDTYLKIIYQEDVFDKIDIKKPVVYELRHTVKVIVENEVGELALVTNPIHNLFILPGGGAESSNLQEEAKRECLEEIGWEIKILKEVGKTMEFRDRDSRQYITTCFYAKVVRKITDDLRTVEEKENNLTTKWFSKDKVLKIFRNQKELVRNNKITFYNIAFNIIRDGVFIDTLIKNE